MALRETDPETYINECTLVYEKSQTCSCRLKALFWQVPGVPCWRDGDQVMGASKVASLTRALVVDFDGTISQVSSLPQLLSHKMYLSIGFRKSNPPQNRQLIVYCY